MNSQSFLSKISCFTFVVFCILIVNSRSQAQLFTQNFSSSSVVADYVSATPNNGQFNSISSSGAGVTVSINNGTLQYTRGTANAGSFSRTTDFSPVPSTLIYKIDITVSNNSAATTSAATFQVGSAFGTANSTESNANTYARFGINISATSGNFSIRDLTNTTNSAEFSGTQTITWVLNNSGATSTYTAPDNTQQTVANDTADLYVGTLLVFNDVAIQTPTQTITDLKFAFTGGTATIQLDNIVIDPIPVATAAGATAGGRITESNGRGIFRTLVTMTDSQGNQRTAYTNQLGYYNFENVPGGQVYVFSAVHRRYLFDQPNQVQFIGEDEDGINFIGSPFGIFRNDLWNLPTKGVQ